LKSNVLIIGVGGHHVFIFGDEFIPVPGQVYLLYFLLIRNNTAADNVGDKSVRSTTYNANMVEISQDCAEFNTIFKLCQLLWW